MEREMSGILFALGNPLLDISAEVDKDFLEKYDLKPNDAILAEDKHKSMYDDLTSKFEVEYVPGGATQNVVRVAQWLIGIHHATTFVGCIGKDDKYGKILEAKATEAGVNVKYMRTDKEPTGTCAVLITGKSRSLCAYLAAANLFSRDHLDVPEVKVLMEKAKYFYISGFPLTVSPESMLHIAEHAGKEDKYFCFNLSAPFLCSAFKEPMMKVMPYVDYLFGNESEAEAFAKENNFGTTDLKEIAKKMASLPKFNGSRVRTVIITQGSNPTIVYKNGEIKEFPVIHISPEEIVDTNGAGDAFAGGFMAQLVQEQSLEDCIRCANYAANLIIQRSGCTLPERNPHSVNPGF